ncbi:hypothetical protein MTO96_044971 [Rhipicephalus appendiculatus]
MSLDRPVHRNHFRTPTLPSRRPKRTPVTRCAPQQPQLAVARRRPTYHLRPRRRASLYNAANSCHRSHQTLFASSFVREVNCDSEMSQPPRLKKALQAKLQITLPDDFCLRIYPTNNTFTASTTHSSTAEILKTLTSLTIGSHTYPCEAYVAPPPGATIGVISNAFDHETPTQLYQDLVRRNPEHTILAARRMGKTHSILITFDANEVPNSIK